MVVAIAKLESGLYLDIHMPHEQAPKFFEANVEGHLCQKC